MSYYIDAKQGIQPVGLLSIVNEFTGEHDVAHREDGESFFKTEGVVSGMLYGRILQKRNGWARKEFIETNVKERNMKLEVYKERKEEEKAYYLDLIDGKQFFVERTPSAAAMMMESDLSAMSRDVCLVVRDQSGKICSNLIIFKSDGTFMRCKNVDKSLGFKLDEQGRIVESV